MDEDTFWSIIAMLDWNQEEDEAVVEPAIVALSEYPPSDILEFEQIMAEKLHTLDGEEYAKRIGEWAFEKPFELFSPWFFMTARCFVVASGREFYEEVLADPESMPQEVGFEYLITIAPEAYRRKTGKKFDPLFETRVSPETFSNREGWPRLGYDGAMFVLSWFDPPKNEGDRGLGRRKAN